MRTYPDQQALVNAFLWHDEDQWYKVEGKASNLSIRGNRIVSYETWLYERTATNDLMYNLGHRTSATTSKHLGLIRRMIVQPVFVTLPGVEGSQTPARTLARLAFEEMHPEKVEILTRLMVATSPEGSYRFGNTGVTYPFYKYAYYIRLFRKEFGDVIIADIAAAIKERVERERYNEEHLDAP